METVASQIAHWMTFGMVTAILGFTLKQHKVWIRMKDRMNTLWHEHTKKTGEKYIPLENGH
jgi:hypothetical protein